MPANIFKTTISGAQIKRIRVLREMKQCTLSSLFGVSQSTVSKWENDTLEISNPHLEKLINLCTASIDSQLDQWICRLVENSKVPVHLMCEVSHVPLVASDKRIEEWGCELSDLLGRPLSTDLPNDIVTAEIQYREAIFNDPNLSTYHVETIGRQYGDYRINPAKMVWERVRLSGGEWARLVTNV